MLATLVSLAQYVGERNNSPTQGRCAADGDPAESFPPDFQGC
jgi:hypothetical protein